MTRHFKTELERFRFDPFAPSVESEVARARQKIENRLGGLEAVRLPEDAEQIWRNIRREWSDKQAIPSISPRLRRWLPRFVFYPDNDPSQWLIRDPEFREALRAYLLRPRQSKALAALCQTFLWSFPEGQPDFGFVSNLCREGLNNTSSVRTAVLRQAHTDFQAFSYAGPQNAARHWLKAQATDSGASSNLVSALSLIDSETEFARRAAVEMLRLLKAELTDRPDVTPVWIETRLSVVRGLRNGSGNLEPNVRSALAESLLEPFSGRAASESYRDWARPLILQHVGDPRRNPVPWSTVSEVANGVMLGWLVQDTLDQFFHVLDSTAKDRHWRHRKRFWQAYLDADTIRRAWIVLGRDAARFARKSLKGEGISYGRLSGGDHSQSVLLMEFGPGFVVAEWSHDGACRFWNDITKAPVFFKASYESSEFRENSVERVVHQGASPDHWQGQIANVIRRYTNIRRPIGYR